MADKMLIDELIKFCDEKSKNIKLKAEPQVFIEIKQALEELKNLKPSKKGFITIGQTVEEFEKEIREEAIREFAERLKERIVGMQMAELQGEDMCPCAKTGEECPYINQDVGCQYCAREHTIKEINEIAEEMRGGEKWETQLKIMKRKDVKRGKKPTKKCKKWFLMYWLKGLVFQGK